MLMLFSMPGGYVGGFLLLTGIVIIYLAAKALMRYLDRNRKR